MIRLWRGKKVGKCCMKGVLVFVISWKPPLSGHMLHPIKHCNKLSIGETQCNLEKRIYEQIQPINSNDDRNTLFSHVLKLKHTFNFSQVTLIKHTLQKTPETTWLCGHFQNKQYNKTSRILPNLTTPGEHQAKRKHNQNRKRIEKCFFHSAS